MLAKISSIGVARAGGVIMYAQYLILISGWRQRHQRNARAKTISSMCSKNAQNWYRYFRSPIFIENWQNKNSNLKIIAENCCCERCEKKKRKESLCTRKIIVFIIRKTISRENSLDSASKKQRIFSIVVSSWRAALGWNRGSATHHS